MDDHIEEVKNQVTTVKQDVFEVKKTVTEVRENVNIILNLLQGNDRFGEDGFVKTTKQVLLDHNDRLEILEVEQTKNIQLKKMLFWFSGIVITEGLTIIFLLIKQLLKL